MSQQQQANLYDQPYHHGGPPQAGAGYQQQQQYPPQQQQYPPQQQQAYPPQYPPQQQPPMAYGGDGGPLTQQQSQPVLRARPFFSGGEHNPQNNIRGYFAPCCCGMRPGTGPDVPEHWLDGGDGWTTRHFVDVEPFSFEQQTPGVHRCKYCSFQAEGTEGCCGKGMCWCPCATAPAAMKEHLAVAHQITAPPPRQWATECTDTEGCCEACLCWQCQASRQMMAQRGWANSFNCFWCLYFSLAGGRHEENGQQRHVALIGLAAWLNRRAIRDLHHIDEGCCMTMCLACFCPVCSLAQTHREFSAGGVWPGGVLAGDAPPQVTMDQPPPGLIPASTGGRNGAEYAKLV